MAKPKPAPKPSCKGCWFSGMEPVDENPHGRLRWVCCVTGAATNPHGHCARWAADTGTAPRERDFALVRAQRLPGDR